MSPGSTSGQSDDRAPRPRIPVGRSETGQRRHEVDVIVALERFGKGFGLGGVCDQAESVAQPLDGSAGDEDRCLECVGDLIADSPRHGRKQTLGRIGRAGAGIQQDEAAGAIGVLGLTGAMASLAEQRCLLIACDPRDGNLATELRSGAEHVTRGQRLGHGCRIDPEQRAEIGIPAKILDVEQHRPRCVRVVSCVSTGEPEDQVRIDRSEDGPSGLGHIAEHPLDLGPGKIGIDHESSLGTDHLLDPCLGTKLIATGRGPPVLPYERPMKWLAGGRVPCDYRLALVGDADRCEILSGDTCGLAGLGPHTPDRLPDLLGVVLYPTRLREMLSELAVGATCLASLGVEDDAGRSGGSLIYREDHNNREAIRRALGLPPAGWISCSTVDSNRVEGHSPESTISSGGAMADIEAHITGTVWKIEVKVGDEISDGDTVVILESMKMEMPVESEDDGVVKEVRCEEGQSVSEGDTLIVLE